MMTRSNPLKIILVRRAENIYLFSPPGEFIGEGSCKTARGRKGTGSRVFRFNKTKGPVSSLPRHSLSKYRPGFFTIMESRGYETGRKTLVTRTSNHSRL